MKGKIILLFPFFILITGCQSSLFQDTPNIHYQANGKAPTQLVLTDCPEQCIIYTSTDILSWTKPVEPLKKGLIDIINQLKQEKLYFDKSEYLFIINENQTDAQIDVFENYVDEQVLINQYFIDYQTEEIELLEREGD